jgi:mannose-6-phosphate isomerase-like protein (cupin superfamily)
MVIKDLDACEEFTAGDHTRIREILNPYRENITIRYSLAHATLCAGEVSLPHRLATSEVYYILEGSGIMHIDEETKPVRPHETVYIPPNSMQFIENTENGDLTFLCIVDPAWRAEDEEVLAVASEK